MFDIPRIWIELSILSDLKSGKYFQVALGLADVYVNTGFFSWYTKHGILLQKSLSVSQEPSNLYILIHSPLIHLRLQFYILNPLAKLDLSLRRKRRILIKLEYI